MRALVFLAAVVRSAVSLEACSPAVMHSSAHGDVEYITTALGAALAPRNSQVLVIGHNPWGLTLNLLESFPTYKFSVFTQLCAGDENDAASVISATLRERVDMQCGSFLKPVIGSDSSFDAVLIDGGDASMVYGELLSTLIAAKPLAAQGGLVLLRDCSDAVHMFLHADEHRFASSQAWKHAESFGTLVTSPGARTTGPGGGGGRDQFCMGRFTERLPRPDDSVQLEFLEPRNGSVYFASHELLVNIGLRITEGDAGRALQQDVSAWDVCFEALPTSWTHSGKHRAPADSRQPVCKKLTVVMMTNDLPILMLNQSLQPTAIDAKFWTIFAWLQVAPEHQERYQLHRRVVGLTSISIVQRGGSPSLEQAMLKRFQLFPIHDLVKRDDRSTTRTKNAEIIGEVLRSTRRRWAFMFSCTRGTGKSVFDFARQTEDLLGHTVALILCVPPRDDDLEGLFTERFGGGRVVKLDDWPDSSVLDPILARSNVTDLYMQTTGRNNGVVSKLPGVRNCIHCVFFAHEPYGDAYAKISPSVVGDAPVVPYMVDVSGFSSNLRDELGIPEAATVFGRYGGDDTFDIRFVQVAVDAISQQRPDVYFLFMNTSPFCCLDSRANVIYLPSSGNLRRRRDFIDTCDAMLHARELGETFGNAVAEFSSMNRPVLTFAGSYDQAHVSILGEKALLYHDTVSLTGLILAFNRSEAAKKDWNQYRDYSPEAVMAKFVQAFW
mmetsp:Transcript_68345/g.137449  ORF Transcript_68345/g.137449 Transcript_68345/m.137449 type:complete len:722 (-) Transcript_68345:220-2385(-)